MRLDPEEDREPDFREWRQIVAEAAANWLAARIGSRRWLDMHPHERESLTAAVWTQAAISHGMTVAPMPLLKSPHIDKQSGEI